MNTIRKLCLAVVLTTALTAAVGAGTASAGGVFCEVQQNPCPEAAKWAKNKLLDFELEPAAHVTVTNLAGTVTYNSCPWSTFETEVVENPSAENEVTTRNASLLWGRPGELCDSPMTTIELSNLKITNIFGTWNGTVRADGEIKVTIKDAVIGNCIYGIKSGAHMGELKEGKFEPGKTAPTLGIKVEAEKRLGDPCGLAWPAKVLLTASYSSTNQIETTLVVSSG